jgi:hypothetical protein
MARWRQAIELAMKDEDIFAIINIPLHQYSQASREAARFTSHFQVCDPDLRAYPIPRPSMHAASARVR